MPFTDTLEFLIELKIGEIQMGEKEKRSQDSYFKRGLLGLMPRISDSLSVISCLTYTSKEIYQITSSVMSSTPKYLMLFRFDDDKHEKF